MPRRPHVPNDPTQKSLTDSNSRRADKRLVKDLRDAQKTGHPDELSGGPVRTPRLTPEQKSKIAKSGPVERWKKGVPRPAKSSRKKTRPSA